MNDKMEEPTHPHADQAVFREFRCTHDVMKGRATEHEASFTPIYDPADLLEQSRAASDSG
jgi:hypothetical protein